MKKNTILIKSTILILFLLSFSTNILKGQSTQIMASQCGTTLAEIGTNIYANKYSGATKYRFRISDGITTQTLDKTVRYFNFTQFPSYTYNTAYTIDVALEIGGVFQPYGPSCVVNTPGYQSQLTTEFCDVVLTEVGTNIYANNVYGATKYRFKVDDGTTVEYLDKTVRYFNLTQLSSYSYNTTYIVNVAVELNGSFGAYGPTCTVTSPTPVSGISPEFCGTTLATIGTNVYASPVTGATGYRFRISDGTNTEVLEHTVRYFNFTQLSSYSWATQYSVQVAVQLNGSWGAYGAACNVTTPVPTSKITALQCGTTIQNTYWDTLYADVATGVQSYTFTIMNGAQQESLTRTTRYVRPSDFTTLQYNTTYQVAVKCTMNGITGNYGDTCNISITPYPWTKIQADQCGKTLAAVTSRVYATAVTGITDYQFRIINQSETLYVNTGTVRSFIFNTSVPTYKFGTAYSVDVSVQYQGTYQPYGPVCILTTPPLSTKVQASQCGTTLATTGTNIYADNVAGLVSGIYRFKATADGVTDSIDKTVRYFNMVALPNHVAGKTYSVSVKLSNNGVWGDWGTACNITLPTAKSEALAIDNSNESTEFKVNVAPNPFTNTFRIILSDEQLFSDNIDVVLYNATGQIIERYHSNSSTINSINIGETCAKGIYILKVVSGNKISINKLVKE